MSSPDAIQQQRKHIHEFLSITERRARAEATAKQQLEKEKAEAEDYLAGQKKHREQMEVEARKRFDVERKTVDAAFAQVKEKASILLKRAQSAFEDGKNALAELPQMIELKPTSGANVDVTSDDPMVGLKYSVERAEASVKSIEETVQAWIDQKKKAEEHRRNIILVMVGIAILIIVVIFSAQNIIHIQEQNRRATAVAYATIAVANATKETQIRATAFAQATMEAVRPTMTAIPQVQSATDMPEHLQSIGEKLDMEFVYVPEGNFIMGSLDGQMGYPDERPAHNVFLDAFWINKTEVTNGQYNRCVEAGECLQPALVPYWGTETEQRLSDIPVVTISWKAAKQFCEWAGLQLPTEAQWEKAARGPDGRIYPWGNDEPDCNKAQYRGCGDRTISVGSKPAGASPYGALDMAGNAAEWVSDWYSANYYAHSPHHNPTGPESGTLRILRGGGWSSSEEKLRVTERVTTASYTRHGLTGFRCVYPSH